MKSQVIRLFGPRQVTVTAEELEELPQPGSLVARTLYSAISTGTEVAAYAGMPPLRPGPVYPRLVGYCNVAEVVSVGSEVKTYRAGDRILTFQSHRSAFVCSAKEVIALIPENADLPAVATTYLYHLGYNALLRGEFRPGYRVAVIGLGLLGLGTVALGNVFGARTFAFSNQAASLDLARSLGALPCRKDEWLDSSDKMSAEGEEGVDIVVVTSNSWSDWRLALQVTRNGGCICVLGFPGRGEPTPDFNPLDSQFFYDKQLSLLACGYSPDLDAAPQDIRFTIRRNCGFLLELILASRLDPHRLITEMRPWYEIDKAYAAAADRSQPFLTCILDWTRTQ